MNEKLSIIIDVNDLATKDLDRIIRELKKVGDVQVEQSKKTEAQLRRERSAAAERHRERQQQSRTEAATQKQGSDQKLADTRRIQAAEKNASNEKVADTRRIQAAEKNASNEKVAGIRQEIAQDNNATKVELGNIKRVTDAERLQGQAHGRDIQSRRLREQRLAREQRDRHFRIRQEQRSIFRGFGSWSTAIGTAAGLLGVDFLGALNQVGRKMFDVTRQFEALRLGFGTFEEGQGIADLQIARIRQLADLPSVSFEGGIRSVLQLRSAGFDFSTSERILTEISNQVALTGKSTDELNRALYQFVQIGGVGEFRTEEIRALSEIIPAFRRALTETFGAATGEGIQNAIKEMGITQAEAVDRLIKTLEEQERAPTDTITNLSEILSEELNDLYRAIGQDLTPAIKTLIKTLTALTKGLGGTWDYLGDVLNPSGWPLISRFGRSAFDEDYRKKYEQELIDRYGPIDSRRKAIEVMFEEGMREITPDFLENWRDRYIPESIELVPEDFDIPFFPEQWFINKGRIPINPRRQQRLSETESEKRSKELEVINQAAADHYKKTKNILSGYFESIRLFAKEGELARDVFRELAAGSSALVKPFEQLIEQNEKRLADLRTEYFDWTEQTNVSRADREERFEAYKEERDSIQKTNEELRKLVEARKIEFAQAQDELRQATRKRLRDREFPEDVFGVPDPSVALPGKPIPKVYVDPKLTPEEQKKDREMFQKVLEQFYPGRPIGEFRSPIPSTKISPSDVKNQIPTPNLLFSQGTAEERAIAQRNLTLATGQDVLSQALNLPTGSQTADMFLNPSDLQDLRSAARNTTNEWKEYSKALGGVLKQEQLNEEQLKTNIKELTDYRRELSSVIYQFGGLENLPEDIGPLLKAAFEQSGDALERLNDQLEKLEENSKRTKRIYSDVLKIQGAVGAIEGMRSQGYWKNQTPLQKTPYAPVPESLLRETAQEPDLSTANAIESYLSRSGEGLYDQFIAPSLLDLVGIKSGRTAARERNLEELKRSINEQQREITENVLLSARDRNDALLELSRTYEEEKRTIERQYEEERSDAWANWVRQQLTDIPKLIFEQLKLQLSARATNEILNALGIGGGRIPIQGGGLLDRIGGLFGGGSGGGTAAASQYNAPIGPGLSGAQTAGGASLGGTAATAGTALSVALAAHNIATGIVPQWNPHGQSLYDDFGTDLASVIVDPARSFFESFHFNNPMNDNYALQLGRERAIVGLQDLTSTASRYGRESARDLAQNYDQGRAQAEQQSPMSNPLDGMVVVPKDAEFNISVDIGDQGIKTIKFRMEELIATGRLSSFGESPYGTRLGDRAR